MTEVGPPAREVLFSFVTNQDGIGTHLPPSYCLQELSSEVDEAWNWPFTSIQCQG
jgi:hypothetical protein